MPVRPAHVKRAPARHRLRGLGTTNDWLPTVGELTRKTARPLSAIDLREEQQVGSWFNLDAAFADVDKRAAALTDSNVRGVQR
jgi:hypothetical protein